MAQSMEARVIWKEGLALDGLAPSGHRIIMDTDPQHGGQDKGSSPMELLLLAVGGCTGMDVVSILQKKRQPVRGLEIRIRGTRAQEHPRRFTQIELEYIVQGPVSEKALQEAIALSQEKYCSVEGTLRQGPQITSNYTIQA